MKVLSGRRFTRLVEAARLAIAAANGRYCICGKLDSVVRLSILIHGNCPVKEQL